MKCSLGISLIFLKRSLVFPILLFPLFLCTDHWGRLSYLSLLFFGTLHSDGYMFPFFLCFLLLFFLQLFVRPLQTAFLLFYISFSWGWFWSPPPIQCYKTPTKHGPLEKGMANHFSILTLRIPWTVWKGKDMTLKDELPRLVGAQYATGEEWRNSCILMWTVHSEDFPLGSMSWSLEYKLDNSSEITPERMKTENQSKNNTQLWMWLVMEVKSDPVKSNIA